MRVGSLDLRIVIVYELLDGLERSVAELFCRFRVDLLDLLQVVDPDVLISIGLEDIPSNLPPLEARSVDEVAILASSAAIGAVVVAAGHGAEITRLDELVLLEDGLLCGHLVDLSQLDSSLLVYLFELDNLLVGERDENLRWLAWRLLK